MRPEPPKDWISILPDGRMQVRQDHLDRTVVVDVGSVASLQRIGYGTTVINRQPNDTNLFVGLSFEKVRAALRQARRRTEDVGSPQFDLPFADGFDRL